MSVGRRRQKKNRIASRFLVLVLLICFAPSLQINVLATPDAREKKERKQGRGRGENERESPRSL